MLSKKEKKTTRILVCLQVFFDDSPASMVEKAGMNVDVFHKFIHTCFEYFCCAKLLFYYAYMSVTGFFK
jgi:hypothetical protein